MKARAIIATVCAAMAFGVGWLIWEASRRDEL